MVSGEREALRPFFEALVRDCERGSKHASLLLVLATAYITRADPRLPPPELWKVPSIAIH